MKRTTTRLDDETHRRTSILAAERGKSVAELICQLLSQEASRQRLAELREQIPAGFRASDRATKLTSADIDDGGGGGFSIDSFPRAGDIGK